MQVFLCLLCKENVKLQVSMLKFRFPSNILEKGASPLFRSKLILTTEANKLLIILKITKITLNMAKWIHVDWVWLLRRTIWIFEDGEEVLLLMVASTSILKNLLILDNVFTFQILYLHARNGDHT